MATLVVSIVLLSISAAIADDVTEQPVYDWRAQLNSMCVEGNLLFELPAGPILRSVCELKPYIDKFCGEADLPAEQEAAFDACHKFIPPESETLLDACSQEVFGAKYGIAIRRHLCTDGGMPFTHCIIKSHDDPKELAEKVMSFVKVLTKMNQCQWEALGFAGEFPMAKLVKNLPKAS